MKGSKIVNPCSQLVFWLTFLAIVIGFEEQPFGIGWYLAGGVAEWFALYFIRKYRFLYFHFLGHAPVIGVLLGAMLIFKCMGGGVLFVYAFMIFWSLVSCWAKNEYADEACGFQAGLFAFVLFVAYAGGVGINAIWYGLYCLYLFLYLYGTVLGRLENKIEELSLYSHLEQKDMLSGAVKSALLPTVLIGIFGILVSMLGLLPPFQTAMEWLRGKAVDTWISIVEYATSTDWPEDTPISPSGGGAIEPPAGGGIYWFEWVIAGLFFILLVAGFIYSLTGREKNSVEKNGVRYVRTVEEKKKQERVIRRADASIRRKMRRTYTKRVLWGRGRRNDDLIAKTPTEHREKRSEEGVEITQKFVELYEKARYSNDNLTKEDLRNMTKESGQ